MAAEENAEETLCRSCKYSMTLTYLETSGQDIEGHTFCKRTPTLIKFDPGKIVVNCTEWKKR